MIFRSNRFRFVARLLALVLLAWTTADLCGHGVCSHDREPIVPWAMPGNGPLAVGEATDAPSGPAALDGPDDCFCCCHCIEVPVRYQFSVTYSFVSMVFPGSPADPISLPSPLDHPPIA